MSYTINIGTTSDDIRRYKKEVSWIQSEGTAKEIPIAATSVVDQLEPVFIVDYDAAYLTCNYVYCQALGLSYFCRVSENTAKRIVLTCTVDPLSVDIDNCKINVIRNGGLGAPTKIQDSKLPVIPGEQELMQTVATHPALTTSAEWCYVITVIGGSVNNGN
ncbi:MAG: hypothetical protein J6R30_09290 [Bacteroidales bacterium]|nr:hypothetical protein [Bacteroidales bacterium]